MKVIDYPPQERRLLRHLKRIDPGVTLAMPHEMEAAERLEKDGMIERVGAVKKLSRSFKITEQGRAA